MTVFADGPTRVLRFSDDPSTVNVDTEQSILDLAARLKQVCFFCSILYFFVFCLKYQVSKQVVPQPFSCFNPINTNFDTMVLDSARRMQIKQHIQILQPVVAAMKGQPKPFCVIIRF